MNKEEQIKHIFEIVYQWGRIGLVTDEKCNTFQDMIKDLLSLDQPQEESKGDLGGVVMNQKGNVTCLIPQEEIAEIDTLDFLDKSKNFNQIIIIADKIDEIIRVVNKIN